MTDILRHAALTPRPWKNGGGVTRELAVARHGDRMAWRLSLAEVAGDGPFSDFSGYARVLTVIRGDGMVLHTPDTTLHARPAQPVRFDGATPITATLTDGPLEDFNLIYDPTLCTATVLPLHGPAQLPLPTPDAAFDLVLCVFGTLTCGSETLGPGDALRLGEPTRPGAMSAGATALHVTLRHLSSDLRVTCPS